MAEQTTTQKPAEPSPAPEPVIVPVPDEDEYEAPDLEAFTPEQHQKWLQTGEFPKPQKPPEKSAPSEPSEKAQAESEPAEKKPETEKPAERKPQNAETRIVQLEEQIAQLKAQKAERIQQLLDERRALQQELTKPADKKPEPAPGTELAADRPKRPKMNEFEDLQTYEKALEEYEEKFADWKVQQRIEAEKKAYQEQVRKQTIEQRNAQIRNNWETRLVEAKKRYGDFDEVVRSVDLPLNPFMDGYLLDSEKGPELVYALCKNPAEAERISKLGPFACARELAKFESSFAASLQPPPKKTISETKPPPTELPGTNRQSEDEAKAALEAGDVERYMRIMNQRDVDRIVRK